MRWEGGGHGHTGLAPPIPGGRNAPLGSDRGRGHMWPRPSEGGAEVQPWIRRGAPERRGRRWGGGRKEPFQLPGVWGGGEEGGGAAEPQNGGRTRGQRLFLILQHHGRAEGCRDSAGGAALGCCDQISTGELGMRLIPVGSIKSSHTESLRVGKASEIPSPSHRATARVPQCRISIFLAHLQGPHHPLGSLRQCFCTLWRGSCSPYPA